LIGLGFGCQAVRDGEDVGEGAAADFVLQQLGQGDWIEQAKLAGVMRQLVG
jgi:hypothetical protein